MSTDRKIRELEESIKKMQKDNSRPFGDYSEKSNPASDLLQFFIGLVLLGAGLFWVFQKAIVSTSFSQMMLGNFAVPNGAVIIPLLIGIVMLFFCEKRIFGWIVTVIGVLIILLTKGTASFPVCIIYILSGIIKSTINFLKNPKNVIKRTFS